LTHWLSYTTAEEEHLSLVEPQRRQAVAAFLAKRQATMEHNNDFLEQDAQSWEIKR